MAHTTGSSDFLLAYVIRSPIAWQATQGTNTQFALGKENEGERTYNKNLINSTNRDSIRTSVQYVSLSEMVW